MTEALWTSRLPPQPGSGAVWVGEPATLGELSALRRRLRTAVLGGALPAAPEEGAVDLLLLAVEELASNALRHGRAPVRVVVTATGSGWLLDVSDAAADRPPAPAIGRDAADGGMGLYLVARLCGAHGWAVRGERKHVWACIDGSSTQVPAG